MIFDEVKNFTNGDFKSGSSNKIHAVISPLDGSELTTFKESTMEDLNEIVDFAKKSTKSLAKSYLERKSTSFL